ncbi:MAG TPA: class I SAM-dependent methyltransferase [Roseococcus sp.]|nr:class I SAM-dependent methyltransferase [Roseococcus sp.]
MFLYALGRLDQPRLARMQYMRQGARAASTVVHVAQHCFGPEAADLHVLDFASGYGRVTRYLAEVFGRGRVWASDVQPGSMEFCRSTLGVNVLPSTPRPDGLASTQRFDLIFVASLFSHLPRETFAPWLAALARLLRPGGVIAFSVHGQDMVDPALFPADGHLFVAESESRVLDTGNYGTAYVSDAFVRDSIRSAFGEAVEVRLLHKGLCGAQDLYVVSADAARGVARLPDQPSLTGYVDSCVMTPAGQLRLTGWAGSLDPTDPADVIHVALDGMPIARCAIQLERPDVAAALGKPHLGRSGFLLELGVPPPHDGTRLLEVRSQTRKGDQDQLLLAPLGDLVQG